MLSRPAGGLCEIVHLIETDDAPRLEAELHKTYRAHRVCGEWFRLGEGHVAVIRSAERTVYATPRAPRKADPCGPVVTFRPTAGVSARLEKVAATIGVSADVLARRVVAECLAIYERRAEGIEERRAADASWHRSGG